MTKRCMCKSFLNKKLCTKTVFDKQNKEVKL